MKSAALLAALALLLCSPAAARDLDYKVADGGRYCEFRLGGSVPARLMPFKTWRYYREPTYWYLMRSYRVCGGKARVEAQVEGGRIVRFDIVQPGVCAVIGKRRICAGETLASVHRRFPQLRMAVVEQEGTFFDASLSPTASLLIDEESLQSDAAQKYCADPVDAACFRVIGRQKIRGFAIAQP